MSSSNIRVAVIGGGIGGVCATLALVERGIDVQLYEKAASFGEYGAGLGFEANSIKAMSICSPKIREVFEDVVNRPRPGADIFFELMDGMNSPPRGSFHYPWDGISGGAYRPEFLDGMVKQIPEGVAHLNKQLLRIDDDDEADGPCTLHFADGSTATADAVLGYDGIGSHIRHKLLGSDGHPAARAQYSHQYIYRLVVPMEQAKAALGEARALTSTIFLGERARVIAFPISHGRLSSVAGVVCDDQPWPSSNKLIVPATKADVMRDFAHFNDDIKALLAGAVATSIDKWALYDTADAHSPVYARGRVCIAGDAAHASTPHLGVGAGFAIEDAAALATALGAVAESAPATPAATKAAVTAALKAYETVRMPRAAWLPPASRRSGRLMTYSEPGVGDNIAAIEREWKSLGSFAWEYDVDKMLDEVKAEYEKLATSA